MSAADDEARRVTAEVSTKASLYAEGRVADVRLRLAHYHPDDLVGREHLLALELSRAWIAGHLAGMEHAWKVLAEKLE